MGTSQVVLVGKNPPASAGDVRDRSSIPGLGRSPGRGNGNLLQYSCLENPMDRRSWRAVVHRLQSWIQLKWFSTHPDVQWACPKWFHCIKGQGVGPFSGLFRAVREHSVRGDPLPHPWRQACLPFVTPADVRAATSPGCCLIASYPLFFDRPIVSTRSFLEKFFLRASKLGLPWWLCGKESTYNAGCSGFGPWVGKIPWRRKWAPSAIFLPGESHGQRSLEAAVHGVTKSCCCCCC